MDVSGWGPVGPFVGLLSHKRPLVWRLAFAALVTAATFSLRFMSSFAMREYAPFMFQLPALMIVTLVSGLRIGMLAVALSLVGNAVLVPAAAWRDMGENFAPFLTLLSFAVNSAAICLIAALLRASVVRLLRARQTLAAAVREKDATLATLEALLSHAPIGFGFFDRQHRFVRVNEALARMNGIPTEEHIGRSVGDLLPHFAASVTPLLDRVFTKGEVIADVEAEGTTPAAPGIWRHWIASYFPVHDTTGSLRFVGVTVVEITERKATERALAASERRYRLLAEALPKMVWTAGADGMGDYYNHRWSEYTGADTIGPSGTEWHDFLHPEERDCALKAWRLSLESGEPFSRECRFKAKDGSYRWFLCRAVPVRDDDGKIDRWYGSCTDISDIVAAREALARSHDELEQLAAARTRELAETNHRLTREMEERAQAEALLRQAQKMEAVGRLTGGIAHDFNNLLTVIIGNIEAAERRIDPGAGEIRGFLDNGRQGALRAATLTQRLLAFSRRQPLDPRPTDVNRLLVGMAPMLSSALGEQVMVETVLSGGLWQSEIDRNQLENALLNLAVNARDAMPAGGKLTIETANAYLDEIAAAGQDEVTPGRYVVIAITDTGVGMTEEVLSRAFEPFFTTKGPQRGTGLGLSQVYGFVKQSGGHVKAESTPGVGTTMKLYLPRLDRSPREQGDEMARPCRPAPPAATVLVAETDAAARGNASDELKAAGYLVLEAAGAEQALALIDEGARPDLLLADVWLGGGTDGRTLAVRARQRLPHLRVLFTAAPPRTSGLGHRAREDHGLRLLLKPFSANELVEKVKAVLEEPVNRGTALLVEDEPFVALVARQILEDDGFDVTVASHGEAALDHVRGALSDVGQKGFVLAVVDVGLPDIRGDSVVRELRALVPDLPVVIATGYGTEDLEAEFGHVSGVALIGKPYDGATLQRALRHVGFDIRDE